ACSPHSSRRHRQQRRSELVSPARNPGERKRSRAHRSRVSELLTCSHGPVGRFGWTRLLTTAHRAVATTSLLLRFLCPRISQRDRAIEDKLAGPRIGIEGEVTETLELITQFRNSIRQRRLTLGRDDFE